MLGSKVNVRNHADSKDNPPKSLLEAQFDEDNKKEDESEKEYPYNCPIYNVKAKMWSHAYTPEVLEACRLAFEAWKTPGATKGWNLSTNKPDLKIYRKPRREKTVDLIKGRCVIPFPVAMVVQEMMCRESKLKYETNLEACKMLKSFGPGALLEYSLAKTPSVLISQRDMVMAFGTVRLENGAIMVAYKSVESPLCPVVAKYVRVDLGFAGWIFEPHKNSSTLVTTIIDIDVKASYIPGWILNLCNESIGKAGYQLKLFMEKKYKKQCDKNQGIVE